MTFQGLLMCEKEKSPFRVIMEKGVLCTIFLSIVLLFAFTSYATETIELPDELKDIQITDEFLKPTHKRVGVISVIKDNGKLIVVRKPYNKGFYADVNDSVYEHDMLYTLSDCKCRITLFNDDEIVMAANSHLEIKEMYTNFFKSEKRTMFGMSKGKAVFYIKKVFQFHYKKKKIQLETPNTIIGVRGTTFGVEIKKVKEGRADMLNRMIASTSLQQLALGPTNSIETTAYVSTGIVSCLSLINQALAQLTNNQTVISGPMGLGPVAFNPAAVAAFLSSVAGDMDPGPESSPASSGGNGGGGGSH